MTPDRPRLPTFIDGYGAVRAWDHVPVSLPERCVPRPLRTPDRADNLRHALDRAGLRDGATISFHHHLRDGDALMVSTLQECAKMGLRNLHIAPSSLFPCHAGLVPLIEQGVITRITTSYMNGPVAQAVQAGKLAYPAVLQTHGGRAAAIEDGRLPIDLAVIAAPAVDGEGNLSGAVGRAACGPLGYAMVDAAHAGHVIAVTDMPDQMLPRICIPAGFVDQITGVESLGDATRIASGTTSRSPNDAGQRIAAMAAKLIELSLPRLAEFSFQTGAGATSIAVARALAPILAGKGLCGAFACGGITAQLVDMYHAGMFRELHDVQAFDQQAVLSYAQDAGHLGISASDYASPARADAVAHQLGVVVLGAAEVDQNLNVNVTTTSDGRIIGGSGGHSDVAEGAKLTLVTTPLRSRHGPKLVRSVAHRTTPGHSIDLLVTEEGVLLGPRWQSLETQVRSAGLPLLERETLWEGADTFAPETQNENRIVAVSEYRDGRVIDVIRSAYQG